MSLLDGLGMGYLSLHFINISLFHGYALCVLFLIGTIIYGYALTPIRHIPGPWISRLFPLQGRPGRLLCRKRLLNLHLKYGPLVRLGPKIISIQGTDVIHTIYGSSSTWARPSQAPQIITKSRHGVLQSTASLDEIKCRNILEPSFSSEAIAAQQHVILNCADTALTVTEIACENDVGKVDVLQIARAYAFDVITEILYGGSWQGRGTHSERKAHLNILDQSMENNGVIESGWIYCSLKSIITRFTEGSASEKTKCAALMAFQKISTDSVKAYLDDFLCKPGSSRGCLASLIESKDAETSQLNATALNALFKPVIIASVDTICATLTLALWDLARFPEFRKRAAEEVAKFFPSRDDMTAIALRDLPFLNAFLRESMRYHGASISLNERVVPDGGAVILGHFIPAGVTVLCDPYCRSMDPTSFPSPENFEPERWLAAGTQDLYDMTMIFSYGARTCLGKSLAEAALRFAVASMLFEYDFETCAESDLVTVKDLEKDISKPWRRNLILKFNPRLQNDEDLDMQGYSIIDAT